MWFRVWRRDAMGAGMAAGTICTAKGCPALADPPSRTCEAHRVNTRTRGYDLRHKRLRAKWAREVAAGVVDCWRCGARISPLEPWDLGHDDYDRSVYRGPEHRACNRATAGR